MKRYNIRKSYNNGVHAMDIDYKAIGKRIRVARIQQDMKQDVLAEKANLSPSHMSNIETGRTKLSLPTLISLANALNASPDELLCDNVVKTKPVLEQSARALLDGASDFEARVMVSVMEAARDSIRKNIKFERDV